MAMQHQYMNVAMQHQHTGHLLRHVGEGVQDLLAQSTDQEKPA